MKKLLRLLPLLALAVPAIRAQEASAYRPESTTTNETFSTKILKVFSVQEAGADYTAYVVDWRGHEVVVTPFSGLEADNKLKPGDTVRCQMQQITQRVGENPVTRMMFTMLPSGMNPPIISSGEDPRRLEAINAEVQRRRAMREGLAPQVPVGVVRAVQLPVPPAIENSFAVVKAADAERVAATKAGDAARLDAIYSDDLRYAHSSGHVDTKASYVKSLTSRSTVYESYDYKEQNFTQVATNIVLMTGRVLVKARSAQGVNDLDLNYLAVWREEGGKWRFLAWQSNRVTPPAPAPAAK